MGDAHFAYTTSEVGKVFHGVVTRFLNKELRNFLKNITGFIRFDLWFEPFYQGLWMVHEHFGIPVGASGR